MPHPQRLDRSNDDQDHTVLPYARLACRYRFRRRCARCRRPDDEPNLTAPLVGTKFWAHGEQSALPALSRPTLSRPPQARLYDHHDTWPPLKGEPGWAIHTPIPNFGKVEYFRAGGLTGERHRAQSLARPLAAGDGCLRQFGHAADIKARQSQGLSIHPRPASPGVPMPSADTPATRLATRLAFLVAGFGIACWAPLVPFAEGAARRR
ncbi:hypothetical protein ACVWWG_000901 [Bradyrhizobium sp. LB7.2]